MLTKQSTQLLNQLEPLLYSANPELLTYCKDGVPGWVLKLLKRYPTAAKLARAKAVSVARIPYISSARAQQLILGAKKSVASVADKVTEQLIRATVKQILHLRELIASQTEIMVKDCSVAEVDLLKTFSGINDYSAVGLILEIQTITRFSTVKKLASFFGLHPVYKISGDGSGSFRMSKKGRKEPRRILFMVALSAIRSNPLIRSIYLDRIEQGMQKMAAIGVCMHKILRILYGMLKHNQAFDPEVDRRNRERLRRFSPIAHKNKNRRYQDFDPNAPVSRRQDIKRKERKQSHSDNITKRGIIAPVPPS
jgi:hypothetical protein